MFQQLMTENRFVSLAPDDPDNSDTDPEVTEPHIADKPQDDVSTVSEGTVYYEVNDDTPYFQTGAEPPHERNGKLPTLLTSGISTACYASAINWMQFSALPKKSKPRWAWILHSKCGGGQMLAPARCHALPRGTPPS